MKAGSRSRLLRNGEPRSANKPVRLRARAFQVAPSEALLAELRIVFGTDGVRLVRGQ